MVVTSVRCLTSGHGVRPRCRGGKPCIRGLRIRVVDVLELLANNVSPEQILADYPDLESEDIQASLLFAAQRANHARLVA